MEAEGFLRLNRRSFTVRGRTVTHVFVELPPVVVVAARDDAGRYLLVRQYRGALDDAVLEFPAGHCEPGEDPAAAAVRELEEETGQRAHRVEHLVSFHPTPGYSNEIIHAFRARGLTATATRFDPGEELELVRLSPEDLEAAVRSGELRDGKTILTWLADRAGLSAPLPPSG